MAAQRGQSERRAAGGVTPAARHPESCALRIIRSRVLWRVILSREATKGSPSIQSSFTD
jgi:hypothetical protein